MTASAAARPPELPPSVAEWEDLLLRLEIMPRVLRNTLEDVPEGDEAAGALLGELVAREARTAAWLEAAAGVAEPGTVPAAPARAEAVRGSPRERSDRFAGLRARNFAMLQRRGLEVWEWSGELPGYGRASVYQVLGWLVEHDVRALAALRERVPHRGGAC